MLKITKFGLKLGEFFVLGLLQSNFLDFGAVWAAAAHCMEANFQNTPYN